MPFYAPNWLGQQQEQPTRPRSHTSVIDNRPQAQIGGADPQARRFAMVQAMANKQREDVENDYVEGIRSGMIKGEFRTNPFTGFLERKVKKPDPNNPLVQADAWELADGGMQELFRKHYGSVTGQAQPEQTSLMATQAHQGYLKTIKPQFREQFMQGVHGAMQKGLDLKDALREATKALPEMAGIPTPTTPSATITSGGQNYWDASGKLQAPTGEAGVTDLVGGKFVRRAPTAPPQVATLQKPRAGEAGLAHREKFTNFFTQPTTPTPAYASAYPQRTMLPTEKVMEKAVAVPGAWAMSMGNKFLNARDSASDYVTNFLMGAPESGPAISPKREMVTPDDVASWIYSQ